MEPKVAKQLAQKVVYGIKAEKNSGLVRRNPGRMDGVQWRGASFTCPNRVDDSHERPDSPYDDDDDESDFEVDFEPSQRGVHSNQTLEARVYTISLMDIAKPAKPRGICSFSRYHRIPLSHFPRSGIAKQFEVIDSVPRVIALDDEPEEWGADWEDVEPDTKPSTVHNSPRQTYSAVLASG
jgi:hypothetical protein